jgi:phosphoribosyl 1,2-cyclic phosphodiesterase
VGALQINAVAVPHDAREPCQYRIRGTLGAVGVLTDLGSITPHVVESYADCDALLLEFNHDVDMLLAGDYPPALKSRVGGDWGHLNNEQAVDLLRQLDVSRLHHLVVAHISENNNCVNKAAAALEKLDGLDPDKVVWACQGEGFDWLSL